MSVAGLSRIARPGSQGRSTVHRQGRTGGCAAQVVGDHLAFRAQVGRARFAASVSSARSGLAAASEGGTFADVGVDGAERTDDGLGPLLDVQMAIVREAIGPILAPYGLDADSEDVEGVLEVPDLADRLLTAAVEALGASRIGNSVEGRVARPGVALVSARSSSRRAGRPRRRPVAVRHDDTDANDSYEYPDGVDPQGGENNAATNFPTASCFRRMRDPRRVAVTWDDDIESYTAHTGGYEPVECAGYHDGGMPVDIRPCDSGFVRGTSNCSTEEHDVVCSSVQFLSDHYDARVPTLTRSGLDYTGTIRDTMAGSTVLRCVHNCEETSYGYSTDNFAATPGSNPYNLFIEIDPAFFTAALPSAILGERDFQAGVILHEMLHSLETQWEYSDRSTLVGPAITGEWPGGGSVTVTGARAGCSLGECEETCTPSEGDPPGEWRAAYLQARYYGIDDCGARAFACAYARTFCAEFSEDTPHAHRLGWFAVKQALDCYLGVATVALVATILGLLIAGVSLAETLGGGVVSVLFTLLQIFLVSGTMT